MLDPGDAGGANRPDRYAAAGLENGTATRLAILRTHDTDESEVHVGELEAPLPAGHRQGGQSAKSSGPRARLRDGRGSGSVCNRSPRIWANIEEINQRVRTGVAVDRVGGGEKVVSVIGRCKS